MLNEIEDLIKELNKKDELLKAALDNNERLDFHCKQLWQVISIVSDILNGSRGWADLLDLEQNKIREMKDRLTDLQRNTHKPL